MEKETGRAILNYEFLLFGPPDACPRESRDQSIRIDLDEAAFERKIAAANSYNPDFMHEVTQQLDKFGREPFMVEYLLPAGPHSEWHSGRGKPRYETQGETQVLNGKYQQVIRHEEHFKPSWRNCGRAWAWPDQRGVISISARPSRAA